MLWMFFYTWLDTAKSYSPGATNVVRYPSVQEPKDPTGYANLPSKMVEGEFDAADQSNEGPESGSDPPVSALRMSAYNRLRGVRKCRLPPSEVEGWHK